MATTPSSSRLEARISPDIRALLTRAAELQDRTLTDFVAAAQDAALRVIAEVDVVRLSLADQQRFADALIAPEPPNDALRRAFDRHRTLIDPA